MTTKTWMSTVTAAVLSLSVGVMAAVADKPEKSAETNVLKDVMKYRVWKRVTPKTMLLPAPLDLLCRNTVGREVIETSGNPHRKKYFNVFVNSIGQKAMMGAEKTTFPVGTVIVKEKLGSVKDEKPELLTVMVKRSPGFDKAGGDWEYSTVDKDGKLASDQKNLDHCRSCHAYQKEGDFVFRSYLPNRAPQERAKTGASLR
jgi:hypothetical protein